MNKPLIYRALFTLAFIVLVMTSIGGLKSYFKHSSEAIADVNKEREIMGFLINIDTNIDLHSECSLESNGKYTTNAISEMNKIAIVKCNKITGLAFSELTNAGAEVILIQKQIAPFYNVIKNADSSSEFDKSAEDICLDKLSDILNACPVLLKPFVSMSF
ncbi:hypothetical protein GCM10011607_11930 [Shewanella inventionis]|uniref:Uncharacterized protein n=1 Tax=Shewanella inventionis TaxID=1738770 RepID=A0ABQ1IUU7_9GAMM|nr:hypothetical protein [Shewanella inventionis]GGB53033.1 hypothetical protein GCM10011607_11930 [Shewanella inventionis]